MMLAETLEPEDRIFETSKLVNVAGDLKIQDKDIDLFPESGGEGYLLQIYHSVVKFENEDDVDNWKRVNVVKYGEYIKYISENNADFSRILRLPPPPRQCRPCAAGKSALLVSCGGNAAPECVELKAQIQALKGEFAGKLPSARQDDISWLNVGAFTDFSVGVCRDCPAGTYFSPDALAASSNEWTKPVKDYLGNPAWTLKELRCIPCPYGKFTSVSGKIACDSCESFKHVLEEIVSDLQMRTKVYYLSVPLLKSCAGCPVGTEYQADATAVKKEQTCSSSNI
jgi:hypothetical protein